MKEGLLAPAFILIVTLPSLRALVPAPFNVTVSCRNFETVVHWDYERVSEQPLFRVQILKDVKNADSETTDMRLHHMDISSSVTHIHESYYVNVSAVNGSERSTPAVSPAFSYHKYFPAEVHCTLEFPRVDLSVKGGQITFTFPHPYRVYKDTPFVKNLNSRNGCEECKKFKYSVSYNQTDTLQHEKICIEEVCKGTFHLPGNSEWHCISLSGTELNTDSGRICQREETQSSSGWTYFILVSVFIVLTAALVLIGMVAFMRTMKTMPSLPKTLLALGVDKHPKTAVMPEDYNGQIACPLVSPKTISLSPKTLSPGPKEVVPSDSPDSDGPEEGSRFPIDRVHHEDRHSNQEAMHLMYVREPCPNLCSDQASQWGIRREEPAEECGGSPPYGGFSGYDRPQALEV